MGSDVAGGVAGVFDDIGGFLEDAVTGDLFRSGATGVVRSQLGRRAEGQRPAQPRESRAASARREQDIEARRAGRPTDTDVGLLSEARPLAATGEQSARLTGAAGVGVRNRLGGQRSLLGVI